MNSLLMGLEAQPDYPAKDLTDSNAELLSLMLANPTLAHGGHVAIEQCVPAFRLFHPAAMGSADRIFDEGRHLEAIDYGVVCYEALCAMLAAKKEKLDIRIAAKVCALLERTTAGSIERYVHDAADEMRHELPRTADVIHEASARHYGYFANLAVTGAALAWRMELDVADTPQ